ncbi:MAG TPA: alpha/beta hydrolase [Holophagaceae bacterium]|nr:alpha/beta hydrolase [Holophagaceae bacterium]
MDPRDDQSWRAVPVPWTRRWGRRLLGLLALAGLTALGGLLYEPVAERLDLRNAPAPGRVVTTEGQSLHLQAAGPPSHPVVVLLNGWGMPSASWGWVLPEVARTHLVVRWDPPGYAWSAPTEGPVDAAAQVERLRAALVSQELTGPYVLVGTGLGALEARVFAARHPEEVAGLVLLDPWHQPLLADPAPRIEALHQEARARRFSWPRFRAWWRKEPPPEFGLPPADESAQLAALRTVAQIQAAAAELRALPATLSQVEGNDTFGQRPVVILTSAALDKDGSDGPWAPGTQAARIQMDDLLAKLSTQGEHRVVAGATPVSLVCRQDLSAQVVQAIDRCLGR